LEDRNVVIDYRFAGGNSDRFLPLARQLIALRPDVILATGTPITATLQRETRTIPIVFIGVSDPIGAGFVASLARPGGNITGPGRERDDEVATDGGCLIRRRSEFIYFPGMIRIPEGSSPDFKNKSWTVAAEVNIPQGGANGVLGTIDGRYGGWALLLMDGKPTFAYALSNQPQHKYRVASDQPLAPGNHIIRVKFAYEGGGIGKGATATLLVDEKQVAETKIP
jgi:hypothetical protein